MNDLNQVVVLLLMFVLILTVHEAAHAWAAWKCGDDTAKNEGRLTLNPLSHIDWIGTILIPGLMLLFSPSIALFGWGKPVPVDVDQLRSPKRDHIFVAMAGPLSNLLLTIVALVLLKLLPEKNVFLPLVEQFALSSLFLGVFNMIPVPPLDGFTPFRYLCGLSEEMIVKMQAYSMILLLVLINLPFFRQGVALVTLTLFSLLSRLVGLS
jgi:Zn-dependent protease